MKLQPSTARPALANKASNSICGAKSDKRLGVSRLGVHEQKVVQHPPLHVRVRVARPAGEVDDLPQSTCMLSNAIATWRRRKARLLTGIRSIPTSARIDMVAD